MEAARQRKRSSSSAGALPTKESKRFSLSLLSRPLSFVTSFEHAAVAVATNEDDDNRTEDSKPQQERAKEEKRRERPSLPIDGVPEGLKRRHKVINEIIDTEKDYVYDLQVLVAVYKTPLLSEGIMPKDEITAIFSNVTLLMEVNKVLLGDLVQRVKDSQGNDLGGSFLVLGDYLKLYAAYCINQQAAGEVVAKCERTNPHFRAFLQKALADPQTNRLTLRDYLIKPMQRLCKYPLFLRELVKTTDCAHPDYDKLAKALDKIHNAVISINENKKQEEEVRTMARIIGRFKGAERFGVQLMVPGRTFVQEGTLLAATESGFDPRHYLLFSDLLVLTENITSPDGNDRNTAKLEVAAIIPLLDSQANLNITNEDDHTSITINTSEGMYLLPFTSVALKKKWTQAHLLAIERTAHMPTPQAKKDL